VFDAPWCNEGSSVGGSSDTADSTCDVGPSRAVAVPAAPPCVAPASVAGPHQLNMVCRMVGAGAGAGVGVAAVCAPFTTVWSRSGWQGGAGPPNGLTSLASADGARGTCGWGSYGSLTRSFVCASITA
jgi:hypothetical protein